MVYKKLLNQVKKDERRKKKGNEKKNRGNGRYMCPFINLAKITCLPLRTVTVQ